MMSLLLLDWITFKIHNGTMYFNSIIIINNRYKYSSASSSSSSHSQLYYGEYRYTRPNITAFNKYKYNNDNKIETSAGACWWDAIYLTIRTLITVYLFYILKSSKWCKKKLHKRYIYIYIHTCICIHAISHVIRVKCPLYFSGIPAIAVKVNPFTYTTYTTYTLRHIF